MPYLSHHKWDIRLENISILDHYWNLQTKFSTHLQICNSKGIVKVTCKTAEWILTEDLSVFPTFGAKYFCQILFSNEYLQYKCTHFQIYILYIHLQFCLHLYICTVSFNTLSNKNTYFFFTFFRFLNIQTSHYECRCTFVD